MLKKILLGLCFVNCISYACEQASTSASAVAVPSITLPDISPKAFGVSGGENYLIALHDYAQALLMQHRIFEVALEGINIRDKMINIGCFRPVDIIARNEWLNHVPNKEEILQALRTGQDHELLIKTPSGDYLFAGTPDGIALLLKHRSLFMKDMIGEQHRPLIDDIIKKGLEQNNQELIVLGSLLLTRLERTQVISKMRQLSEQLRMCNQEIFESFSRLRHSCPSLAPQLSECLDSVATLYQNVLLLAGIRQGSFEFMPDLQWRITVGQMDSRITKELLCDGCNRIQVVLYAAVRKKLKEITLQLAKKSRLALAYSKTTKGEPLPEEIQVLNRGDLECRQEVAAVNKSIKPKDTHQVKQRAAKAKKKKGKRPERKNKKHQQPAGCSVSKDGSEQAEEQDTLGVSSSRGVQPVQGAVPVALQEGHQKVSVNPDSCAEQDVVQAAVLVPAPSATVVSELTVAKRERHKEKGKAPAAAEPSAGCHEISLLAGIPDYSDGRVLSAVDGENVIIDDSCNGMRIQLFPTEEGRPRFVRKLCYQANVLLWFQSVKRALQEQGYLDPSSKKYVRTESEAYKKVRIHRFSQLVDRFLPSMGVKGSMPSRIPCHANEIAVAIPGYVEFSGEKKKNPCLFAYLISSDTHRCFHRNIEFRIGQRMIADFYKKGYFEVEFPSLDWQRH